MRRLNAILVTLLGLVSSVVVSAQSVQSAQPTPSATVPRVIYLSGVIQPADGQPLGPVETVTFSIYAEETGGPPLWQETQNVQPNASGRYALLLGATMADGIPLDVFASGEARWLGMTFERPGEVEGPRTRLTSVPYALRAADADTLGGRPASEYLLAPPTGVEAGDRAKTANADTIDVVSAAAVNPGTTNFLAKYVNTADVGNSGVFESGGLVGIGTSTPFDTLHVRFNNTAGTATGYAVQNLGNTSTSYSGMLFYDQNGALGQFQGFNNVTHEYRINNIAQTSGQFDGSINFMIGSSSKFRIASNGDVTVAGNIAAKYQDVAEWVETSSLLEAGTVVIVDPTQPNRVLAAPKAYDTRVAGAVSRQPGLLLGERSDSTAMVAQSGRVRVKADATYGAIKIGDLLVTSPTPGYAMRSRPVRVGGHSLHRPGTLLGKALEALPGGKGEVLVLLTLQ